MRASFTFMLSFASYMVATSVGFAGDDAKPTKKTIRAADGVNLVCEVRGKGETALVFLHGWSGDREYWKNQVEPFASDYKVVTLDQAGHGESGKDRKAWTVAALAGDVETVVKELGLKRVILVGHSMGGPVSLMAAKRLPGTVLAVIGVDTIQNVEHKMPEDVTKKFMAAFEADFPGTLREMFPGMVHADTKPELKTWLIERASAQDAKMALGLMRDMMKLDQAPILKEAKVPVRCINSAGGFKFFIGTAAEVNKKYADYDVAFINEVGHYPMLEKPMEFNQKLREVLKGLAAKKSE